MTERVKLRELCHARSGDKGDTVNVGLIVFDKRHYDWMRKHVTTDVVGIYLGNRVRLIERYGLPNLGALNFVLHGALDGGATRSLMLDAHGKGFSAILLELEVDEPADLADDA